MANSKITELTALTDPASTDVLPIVDVTADVTKKVTIADLLENAGAGSASAAAFAFDGDSGTGMYRSAANSLAFTTGGTGRLFIDSSGTVGIGTSSPVYQLDVKGPSESWVRTDSATATDDCGYRFAHAGVNHFVIGHNGTSDYLQFYDNIAGSERMRIDSSGRLLVGTTTEGAVNADTLTVAESGDSGITIRSGSANAGSLFFSDSTTGTGEYTGYLQYYHSSNILAIGTASTERMRIDSSGNVGIGTSSPGSFNSDGRNLVVGTGSGGQGMSIYSGASNYGTLYFADGTTGDALYRGAILYNHSGDFMRFDTAAGERMRIDSSGRLLVGTSSSSATLGFAPRLQVEGGNATDSSVSALRTSNDSSPSYIGLSKKRGASGIVLNNDLVGRLIFMGFDGSNYVEAAHIEAQIDGTPGANDMPGRIVLATTADGVSTSTERMRISSGGKLTVPGVYNGVTTGGSPVYVETDGDLLRYTSSLKYKTDVETIEDARADAILNCRPVWYRSKCPNDVKTEGSEKSDWGWYGFIAEEVAEIEPRLVNWATKDAVTQEDGSVQSVERDPADYEAEGVRYDNFVPLLLNLVKRQQQAIETLEAKVAALEAG